MKRYIKAERIFELSPQYDSRKSFYGKAKVVMKDNGDYVLYSYNTPVATVRNGKRVPEEEYKASQTTNRHIKEFYRQFEDASTEIDHRAVTASSNSVSKLAKFIEDSVNTLLTTDYTNCRYELDDTWAVYVGWSDAGFDEDDDSVIHDEDSPNWVIGVKIADMEDAMWTDFDWCNMPYDKDTGDVWDTQEYISHDENYSQLASWLLENYEKIVEEYGETEDDDYYIDDDDEDYE